ncbi:hypothetical protein GCM10008906_30250 [Clostridium oceanicum]|uniref:Uncharacterized protein n=1 Tax=Clostridium oceanicum TaxID=1543 RepID=A0ABN1JQW2_9CLOT
MLRTSILEFFLRGIPEALLFILAIYLLLNKSVKENKKLYIISSLIVSISMYLIRLLPIHFGVHTILTITVYIIVFVLINKIEINKAISYSIIVMMILSIGEFINLSILNSIFKSNINAILNNKLLKVILFYPSLIIFMGVILFIYKFNKNRQDICS